MFCDSIEEKFVGVYKKGVRTNEGILSVKGVQYYVQYNERGKEINQRKRTYFGVRIMIGLFFFIFFLFFIFYFLFQVG